METGRGQEWGQGRDGDMDETGLVTGKGQGRDGHRMGMGTGQGCDRDMDKDGCPRAGTQAGRQELAVQELDVRGLDRCARAGHLCEG